MGRSKRRKNRRRGKPTREGTSRSEERAPGAGQGSEGRSDASLASPDPPAASPNWLLAFFAVCCLGTVVWLLSIGAYSLSMHAAAQHWAEVPCTIVYNGYEQGAQNAHQKFTLEYSYTYNGQTYRSTELDLIPGEVGDEDHYRRQLARERPAGTQSVCYVNPDDPSSAVLDRERMDALWVALSVAVPILVIGLGTGIAAVWPYLLGFARGLMGGPFAVVVRYFQSLGVLLALAGVLLTLTYLFHLADGFTQLGWLAYPATARTTGVVVFTARMPGNHVLGQVQRKFEYTYEVDGRPYQGEGYAYWTDYQLDESVTVDYDGASPERSYIVGATPTQHPHFAWVVLALMVLFGTAFLAQVQVSAARAIRGERAGDA